MAADNDVDIKIRLTADTKGGNEAEQAVKDVGKVVGNFTKALGLIGFAVSAIQTVIAAYRKLQEWLHRDEEAARKLREEIEKRAYEESVARVTRNYEQLNLRVAENLRLEQRKNALIDERTSMERSNEDAQFRLDEAKEIAALDQNDPDYGNKAALVSQKYARMRSDLRERRATEDNRKDVDRLYAAADEKDREAAALRKQADWGGDAKRNLINRRAEYAEVSEAARGGDEKARERLDAVRKEYEAAKEAYDKIKASAEAAEKAARELREQAANKAGGSLAAKIDNQAAQVEIDNQERQTRRGIENDRKSREEQARRERERKDREANAAAACNSSRPTSTPCSRAMSPRFGPRSTPPTTGASSSTASASSPKSSPMRRPG